MQAKAGTSLTPSLLEAADRTFQRFSSGSAITRKEVAELLQSSGVTGRIKHLHYGYFRTITASLEGDDGNAHVAKIRLHPYSSQLLRQEDRAYSVLSRLIASEYQLPNFRMVCDRADLSIAVMQELAGTRLRPWHYPRRPLTRLSGIVGYRPLSDYLDALLLPLGDSAERDGLNKVAMRLQQNFVDQELPLTVSHGDFVHWNVLRDSAGNLCLFDFEYFAEARVAHFDDWHWFVWPLCRKAVKLGVDRALVGLSPMLPLVIWKAFLRKRYRDAEWLRNHPLEALRLFFAVYLLEQCAVIGREHQLPDIVELIGAEAHAMREKLTRLYINILRKL